MALSTTESEYIAASQAVKELVWLTRLQKELILGSPRPTLHLDNQSAIRLIKNPEFHSRTKHIDVRYHFIHEKFEERIFELYYVNTDEQTADILTKPLARDKFIFFRKQMVSTLFKNNIIFFLEFFFIMNVFRGLSKQFEL